MTDEFHKFAFLGAMIVIAIFSNRDSLYRQKALIADVKSFTQKSPQAASRVEPPLFVIDSPVKENDVQSNTKAFLIAENPPKPKTLPPEPISLGEPQAVVSENATRDSAGEEISSPTLQSSPDESRSSFKKIGAGDPPQIQSEIALIADLKGGEEFFSIGREKRWPIASITKLMSAAVFSRTLAFNQSTTLTDADFSIESSGKSLKTGERFTVADLMLAALLESSNESVEALARIYGRDNFIPAMNQQAVSWGIPDTHFSDPTGLSPANQSTVSDLRKLALNIYEQYPEILKITRKRSGLMSELNSGKRFSVKNINLFAGQSDFLGGKTGYIEEAGGNLLSIFSYNRKPIFIIVLGSNDRFGDTEKLLSWFRKNFR